MTGAVNLLFTRDCATIVQKEANASHCREDDERTSVVARMTKREII